ncbi:hypothetical protein FNO01nite_16470 [Flavobacterium noncentrifugens]|uniref:Putative membrane protein n=1 Tax=Flavobacterium noncentrifugens TaxID=1128970 RepID=A0A1G8WMY6_9FLAO|nr:PH domain-containing protein [Flavobacterium noncentrifugens]GEP50975.1 hypothetical protein FNO01nite_16470 [Flavobacterium noncentrifugens]SDJ79005.1 putative membrane protein [Flavobacterium noncentrifugens]
MKVDFSQPQRQSSIGVLIMFFDTIQEYGRALWPLIVIGIFKFDDANRLYIFLSIPIIFITIGIIAYLKYRNFTFFIDNENSEFVVTEGVFNKTRTTIQLHKIQQVNIKQSLLQRIIGVHALDVDTAGTNDKEVSIKAVSHELALNLKSVLLDNIRKVSENETVASESFDVQNAISEQPFISISFLSLLKVGITSNYIRSLGLLLAFFVTTYDYIIRFSNHGIINEDQFINYFDKGFVMRFVGILIVLLLAAILIINIFRTIVKFFNYQITKQSGSLLLSFGLFATKSTIIKPEKVQIISVTQNYFQKKFDILELKIKQATSGEKEARKQAIEIPGCNKNEHIAILKLLFGEMPGKGFMLKPNFRKLGFAVFLTIVLPLVLFYLVALNGAPNLLEYHYGVAVYVVFMGIIQYFSFRNNRLFINDRFIIKQSGAWDISNEIIEPHRIQAITTSQLFWHKSLNIGSITLHTAGGNVGFQLGNFEKIRNYANLWLYEMETSDSNWM